MMDTPLLMVFDTAVTPARLALGLAVLIALTALILLLGARRAARARAEDAAAATERAHELDDKLAEMNRTQAEMTGRMQTIAEIFGSRQGELVRSLTERLDGLQHRVGQGLEASSQRQTDHLGKLNERLAVIDAAQKNLTELTSQVVSLKDVLANKQSRGAFGQARMEAIVRDGLPAGAFAFQPTLASGRRPDCTINLPGDDRPLVIDAKFPLEAFTALRDAGADEAARKIAGARVRSDLSLHVKDIAEKYLVPGETQDMALLFVPSEAVYADLVDQFDDVLQKANRARIIIVSPSLMMMAIQVMLSVLRDHRMKDAARTIQTEVRKLLDDVGRLQERVIKLDTHFRQAQDDVVAIRVSADKVSKRGERIDALEFDEPATAAAPPLFARNAAE